MLIIPTIVLSSNIAGIGLFSLIDIPKDTLICYWDDQFGNIFTLNEFSNLRKLCQEYIEMYGWLTDQNIWKIELDNGRFINHSRFPNCKEDKDGNIFSIRDIKSMKEITEDYRVFDNYSINKNFDWL